MYILYVSNALGDFANVNSRKYLNKKTIVIVHALAKLHNFCINVTSIDPRVYRSILNGALPTDNLHVMTNDDRYVPLTDTGNHDVPVPVELLNVGNSKVDNQSSVATMQEG